MRLDVELEHEIARRDRQQLVHEKWRLATRRSRAAQLGGRALVRPSLEVRAERQPRVVQQHQLAVSGQAYVAFQAVGVRGQRARQRGSRIVGPVGAAETVRIQRDHARTLKAGCPIRA